VMVTTMFRVLALCFLAQTNAWFYSGPKEGDPPQFTQLAVKFGLNLFTSFVTMPLDEASAIKDNWKLDQSCDDSAFFRGNRYVLNGDASVMLLFDTKGKIAGIQMGVKKNKVPKPKSLPWNVDGDMYVMTAYFTDPQTICSGGRQDSKYFGDSLLIQTGLTPDKYTTIPIDESGLQNTNWVKGGCFWGMGQHYWYKTSKDMDCDNFYPLFLLYEDARLTGFGWNTQGYVTDGIFEHPAEPNQSVESKRKTLSYFFKTGELPECLLHSGPLTTQHVYLKKRPYFNGC